MFYNDCSPLFPKVNLTHLRLFIDTFLFLLSANMEMLTMRHNGNFIINMLSFLSSSSRGDKSGRKGKGGTEPFSLGREMTTFRSSPEKGKRSDPPSGTC